MQINPEFNNILADAIAKQNEAERFRRENTEIVVRCKDCIHAPLPGDCEGNNMEWPKIDGIYVDCACPHYCGDNWYSTRPDPDGFCEKGERRCSNG